MKYLFSILFFLFYISTANSYMSDEKRVTSYLKKGYELVGTDVINHRSRFDEIIYHLQHKDDSTDLLSCIYSLTPLERTECYRP